MKAVTIIDGRGARLGLVLGGQGGEAGQQEGLQSFRGRRLHKLEGQLLERWRRAGDPAVQLGRPQQVSRLVGCLGLRHADRVPLGLFAGSRASLSRSRERAHTGAAAPHKQGLPAHITGPDASTHRDAVHAAWRSRASHAFRRLRAQAAQSRAENKLKPLRSQA